MTKIIFGNSLPLFRNVPLLRVLIPFLIGILVGINCYIDVQMALSVITFLILLLFIEHFKLKKSRWNFRWVRGVLIQITFLFSGLLLTNLKKENHFIDFYKRSTFQSLIVVIDGIPEEKSKTVKAFVHVKYVVDSTQVLRSSGKLLLYFKKSSRSLKLNYGDQLIVHIHPEPIPSSTNGEFDYKRYLVWHQVFERGYCKDQQWKLLANNQGNYFLTWIYQQRKYITNSLRKSFHSKNEFAVANALLIGDDNDIDGSLMNAYTVSGTLHVLSVSGMHVGVIYLLLSFVLGRLEKSKHLKHLYYPLIIILVWMYGLLSGSSASVLRAAAMLTFVVFGKWIDAKSSIYSSLCVSLFVLLLYDPFIITETGLQLSYLAVFGIVYLHPKIYKSWSPPIWLVHKSWELTSVSISAQMVTAPLGFLMFGQFPNYFIIANLIVIPLTTIAIYLTILQVVFKDFQILEKVIVFSNTEIIGFVNRFVRSLETWPGALTKDVFINLPQCLMLYAIIFSFLFWKQRKDFSTLFILLINVLLFYSSFLFENVIRIFF